MSSLYVRSQTKTHLTATLPTEVQVDLSAQYKDVPTMLSQFGVGSRDNWLGIQFIGNDDIPINITGDGSKGCYREVGGIFFHIVAPVQTGVADLILARAEAVVEAFRGKRINEMVIESSTPPNFEAGATLEFEGGYTSASVLISYHRDLNR